MKELRIIIDTNIYISSFLGSQMRSKLEQLLFNKKISVFICKDIISEIRCVLSRPKFRKFSSKKVINEFIGVLERTAILTSYTGGAVFVEDIKDSFLLNLANEIDADYIITGDRALLGLAKYNDTKIWTIVDFLENII